MARRAALAAALALAIALTGCVADEPSTPSAPIAPSESPDPSASPDESSDPAEPSPLLPVYPADYTVQSVQAETERIASRITGLVAVAGLIGDDSYSQQVENTESEGSYWGVINTITLEPDIDPSLQAASVAADLADAGWLLNDRTQNDTEYAVALTSGENPDQAWFLVLTADQSVPGESVVTVQLSSPPLP